MPGRAKDSLKDGDLAKRLFQVVDMSTNQAAAVPKGAYSVAEFCQAHGGITRQFFYQLVKRGKAPRIIKLGSRTLISVEAAAEWRRQMEAAA